MPTAASRHRKKATLDPCDVIPNLHKTSAPRGRFPFLHRNTGITVSLLASLTSTSAVPFVGKNSSGSITSPRRSSIDAFDEKESILSYLSAKTRVTYEGSAFIRGINEDYTASRVKYSKDMKRVAVKSLIHKRTLKMSSMMEETPLPLKTFFSSFHHSYIQQLSSETPDNVEKSLGVASKLGHAHPGRPVYNGHYVKVLPAPLKNPSLVIYSKEMASELGIEKFVDSEVFLRYFSGDVAVASGEVESWATPYALSIMGTRYTNNVRS